MPRRPSAVRRYLAQFLSDPRVVEIPRWAWKPLLHGVDPQHAPAQSAKRYRGDLDQGRVAAAGAQHAAEDAAARLPRPAAEARRIPRRPVPGRARHALRQSRASAPRSTSCAPRIAKKFSCCRCIRNMRRARRRRRSTPWPRTWRTCGALPALRFVETFHADDGYIKALAQNVNDYWVKHGRPGKLVLSFHGVPRRTLDARRSVSLLLPGDRTPARARARSCAGPMDARVPVALRQGASGCSPTRRTC